MLLLLWAYLQKEVRMRRRIGSFVAFVLLSVSYVIAQVSVNIKLDSLQLFVGEQTAITLDVCCGSKQMVEMPAWQPGQELCSGVELVEMTPCDTVRLNDGKRMQVTRKYIVCAWDSSFYYIPPMPVLVDGKKYESKSLALKVLTLDVDTVHIDRYYGPKAEMEAPFAWEDWRLLVSFSFIFVLLCICIMVMVVSLRTGKPIIRIIKKKIKEPAHKVALSEIEKIKQERTWAQEDSKEYYTQLTDTLRTYIQDRYGFCAMEMTSEEIIERLTEENDEDALNELRDLFRTADLVKFAKYSTLINENDANLMTALEYINLTKQEVDPNQKPEEIIVTPEEKRKITTVWIMRIAIVMASVVALSLLGWVVYRAFDLLW